MKNKLKELSKYCCKPANEQEYEFVKTCAKIGGVDVWCDIEYYRYINIWYFESHERITSGNIKNLIEIPVTQFCDILLKDESEIEFKPKVGEWCAVDYGISKSTWVFMVDRIGGDRLYASNGTFNGKSTIESVVYLHGSITTLRQPTPEEIQTAIDAWDDRVLIRDNSFIKCSGKSIVANKGCKFRLSEDCKTAELIKSK